jgi:transposase-like protein
VIQEAWIGGVSTHRVDELAQAMGLSGISKSTVSELCKDIDERVNEFRNPPLESEWPYLWLDATYLKARQNGTIVSIAAIIAVVANTDGRRISLAWVLALRKRRHLLHSRKARGLFGVKLVISDTHKGLKAAISRSFEATWQRCRVLGCATRSPMSQRANAPSWPPPSARPSTSPDRKHTGEMWRHVADQLRGRWPKRAELMDDSEHDVPTDAAADARCRSAASDCPSRLLKNSG